MTVAEFAQRTGLHVNTVRRRIAAGELVAVRIGGRYFLHEQTAEDLERAARGPNAATPITPFARS